MEQREIPGLEAMRARLRAAGLPAAARFGPALARLQVDSPNPQPGGGEIVLTGPAELLLRPAFAEARRILTQQGRRLHVPFNLESPDEFLEDGGFFGDLNVRVWESQVGSPALTLAHLTRLGALTDSLGTRVEATLQPGEVGGLRVEWRGPPP